MSLSNAPLGQTLAHGMSSHISQGISRATKYGVPAASPEASVASFSYSDGMKAHAAEAPNWTPEALEHFLTNPKTAVKGTKMTFAGLPKVQDRANLIAYLETLK